MATAKIASRKSSKYDQFAKINTREKRFALTGESKYPRKLVLLRYGIRIPTQHSKLTCIHGNAITKFIPCHYSDRVTPKTPVRFFLFPLFICFVFNFFLSFFFSWGRGGGGRRALVKILYTGNLIYHPPQSIHVFIFKNKPLSRASCFIL